MTKIEWCDATWSPITGCTPISEGCQNCYARRMANRLQGRFGYPAKPNQFDVTFHPDRLNQPSKWKKPKRIFVCSMGDLFHKDVTDKQIDSIFTQMAYDQSWPLSGLFNKQIHTFLLLTKRPERILSGHPEFFARWPNIWFGVTAENQKRYDERWTIASQIPAAVKFVSIEPALEYVSIIKNQDTPTPWPGWVIWGPETGPGKRPFKPEWAERTYELCKAAGVPFFDKRKDYLAREFPA